MRRIPRFLVYGLATMLSLALVAAVGAAGVYLYLSPQLPSVESLRDVRYQEPLRVHAADGQLIAEFGENRREPVRFDEIPEAMRHAFIAAEDQRFYEHPGVDYQGIARAVLYLIRHQEIGPGGSTITMQVARNFFLTREQTYLRKLNEILLAFKIEGELSKEQILELYLNKIYLGQRAYGVGAAAQIYYGADPGELTLAQTAMIAGLPKAPSAWNPIADPERALERRAYVLRRMHESGYITEEQLAEASTQPITAHLRRVRPTVEAPFVAEMARKHMVDMVGERAYTGGYHVYTTIDSERQPLANEALRQNLLAYTRRHGYRGPEAQVDLEAHEGSDALDEVLDDYETLGGLRAGIVTEVGDSARVYLGDGESVELALEAMEWARPWISQSRIGDPPETVADVVSVGDVVRVEETEGGPRLAQVPEVEGAVVSIAPRSGALQALAGGFDFDRSKFNRAVQAVRQPGSAFKPFIYAAALENGYTPATVVNDAPVVFEDSALESTWRPENYSGRFYGPTRLREALIHSRNLVSIRVLRDIGAGTALDFLERVGFDAERMPSNLSLALGSAGVTPWELTAGYAVFANGGYRVEPYFIERIEDGNGEVIHAAEPTLACERCGALEPGSGGQYEERAVITEAAEEKARLVPSFRPAERVMSPQNAYLITSMLQDVIRQGTGRAARRLGRDDLAGKTGSTNELQDAWFAGYNAHLVTTAWVGFDQSRSMGPGETGARAALPIWMDYMGPALEGLPEESVSRPSGLVTVRIDPESGLVTDASNPDAIFETFRSGEVPEEETGASGSGGGDGDADGSPLF
ncbi:penicillin-binding protein 1A [Aquisalimonas lutea]|uniref:penicillin-binding protein 1A n=1 Tax=Aquisalimonas lutea TaxID=1327750 RepID=UPI0025B2D589|nr:penicillin-binding protein 1A [Aquisalimonas lutea]MDN3516901.1 penicillin-binding protein 1A [Aquisalimonas lutea]